MKHDEFAKNVLTMLKTMPTKHVKGSDDTLDQIRMQRVLMTITDILEHAIKAHPPVKSKKLSISDLTRKYS